MDAEARDFQVGNASSTQTVYFAGGLRAFQSQHGWALVPIPGEGEPVALVFRSDDAMTEFVRNSGLHYVGTNIQHVSERASARVEFWELGARDPANDMHAADSWSAIAFRAGQAGDSIYRDAAKYLAVSMRLAALRLRDVARHYHEQLEWAIADQRPAGKRFSNVAMMDLYADFHSLAAELGSARDHLARIAAIEAGAPAKIDSLARLEAWLKSPAGCAGIDAPMASLLLSHVTSGPSSWLVRLGEIRNEVVHRVPMAASESVAFFCFDYRETPFGKIALLKLVARSGGDAEAERVEAVDVDSLVELTQITHAFERLARAAWKLAKYPAKLPHFVAS